MADGTPGAKLKKTPEMEEEFLNQLAKLGLWTHAARAAGISYPSVKRWCREDPDFAERCNDALEAFADILEEAAIQRGVKGVERTIYGNGGPGQGTVPVGSETVYSDRLLELTLKGSRPKKYRESVQVNATVEASGVVVSPPAVPPGDWASKFGGTTPNTPSPGQDENDSDD
jgi:hypothetical protein